MGVVVLSCVAIVGCGAAIDGIDKVLAVDCKDVSSDGWKEARSSESLEGTVRIAKSIDECGTLEGMTRGETLRWLGPADRLGKHSGSWEVGSDWMGDSRWLYVELGNGRVTYTEAP